MAVDRERWSKIQKEQPGFAKDIKRLAKLEIEWLRGINKKYDIALQKKFHGKLQSSGIRPEKNSSITTLLEDLIYIAK